MLNTIIARLMEFFKLASWREILFLHHFNEIIQVFVLVVKKYMLFFVARHNM